MDKATAILNFYLCGKLIRREEKCRHLENSEELLNYAIKNKLLQLQLPPHNTCFMKLYNKKNAVTSNSSSQSENESMMDLDVQKVDKAVQTDLITESSITGITTTETKSVSTVTTSSTTTFATFESLSLPFFMLAKSHQKCSICKNYFAETKKPSCDINNELRVNSLLDHHVYIQEDSRCCTDHFIDDKLSQKSIEIIIDSF
ncbi:unnamed protein product, partial [Rotaria sp. Silwood2]